MNDTVAPTETIPDIVVSRVDLTEAVRSTALLADMTVSMWSGAKTDKQVGMKIKEDAGAVGDTGKYVKNLMVGCDTSLKATRAAYSAARAAHYAHTLPWVSNAHAERDTGPRLLPNMLFDRYMEEVARLRAIAHDKLDAFVAEYPSLVPQAMANLGGLAKQEDYPTDEEVRSQFKLAFDFSPIPASSAFQGLDDRVLGKLAAALQRKQEIAIRGSQAAMWARAKKVVDHLIERLASTEGKFKSSTVEGVRELIELLPGFNCAGDPRVDEVVRDITAMLAGVDAEAIRSDQGTREETARRAQAITDKLNQYGGV